MPLLEIEVEGDDPNAKERRLLEEYFGGISNLAPLSAEQQRAILEAKLRHKRTYEIAVRDSGFERESLSTAERVYAHQAVARALEDYRQNFLLDAKPLLTDQQFDLLESFEATEFKRELDRLQMQINAK